MYSSRATAAFGNAKLTSIVMRVHIRLREVAAQPTKSLANDNGGVDANKSSLGSPFANS